MSTERKSMEAGKPSDLHDAAQRMARACRYIVEPVLYEWERGDVEREFISVILTGLEEVSRERLQKIRKAGKKSAK